MIGFCLSHSGAIIGCGGGFRHETSQKYSPILEWIEKVQLCVHDEAQQFGNLDEVAALARLPSSCLCIWTGDHKQTPGGLKKTDEAKAFRKKIMKSPLAFGVVLRSTSHTICWHCLAKSPRHLLTQWPTQSCNSLQTRRGVDMHQSARPCWNALSSVRLSLFYGRLSTSRSLGSLLPPRLVKRLAYKVGTSGA